MRFERDSTMGIAPYLYPSPVIGPERNSDRRGLPRFSVQLLLGPRTRASELPSVKLSRGLDYSDARRALAARYAALA